MFASATSHRLAPGTNQSDAEKVDEIQSRISEKYRQLVINELAVEFDAAGLASRFSVELNIRSSWRRER